jgi:Protein of unknown function (DUF1759)
MERWLQDVVPESRSGRLTNVADENCGEARVAATRKVLTTMGIGARMDDVSKLLARQVLGMDLPKFSGDAKEWPTFITTYRRTTVDCGFSESENMERLRKCLLDPAKHCVRLRMVLLTNNAEKVISMLANNFGGSNRIIEQLLEEAKLQKSVKNSKDFQEFSNLVENLTVTVDNVGRDAEFKAAA